LRIFHFLALFLYFVNLSFLFFHATFGRGATKMLKRHGNFPYDSDSIFPDHPVPAIPLNPVHNSAPPAAVPTPAQCAAPLAASDAPLAAPQPSPAASPFPHPPKIKTDARKISPRKPRRRSGPLKPRSAKSITPAAPPPDESEPSRHARKCTVCHHPERDTIDDDFIHWMKPHTIAREFDLPERAIRRHARATGLHELRSRKSLHALDLIIENAKTATVTGDTVIRAIRAASCINASGKWEEPPKRVIFSIEHVQAPRRPFAFGRSGAHSC
jgi:hypothetical protein